MAQTVNYSANITVVSDNEVTIMISSGSATVTSVGLSMPSAFTVINTPVISAGTLTVTGAGTTSQYIRGDGSLATSPFPGTFTDTRIPFANSSGILTESSDLSFGNTPTNIFAGVVLPTVITSAVLATGKTMDLYGYGEVAITTVGRTFPIGSTVSGGFAGGIGDASFMTVNSGISEGYAGLYSWPRVSGTGTPWKFTVGHKFPNYIVGLSCAPLYDNPGATLTTMLGCFVAFNNEGGVSGGTITNAYDYYASEPNTINYTALNAPITNHYAFYAEQFVYATNNYGVYINGIQKNYMGGTLGIGQTSPTARLHIAAGTATASTAPLKLTSGTNLTTPETGAIEFDGSHFYGTVGSNRRQLDRIYKIYTAILNQTGTSDPVATVLENTLGDTIVWTRSNIGEYVGTLTGAFTSNKTFILTGGNNDLSGPPFYGIGTNSVNTLFLHTFGNPDLINDITDNWSDVMIEIRVYP